MTINFKGIYDLQEYNHKIVYLTDYEIYLIISSFDMYDPSRHIYSNRIVGKDVTDIINNATVINDKMTLATFIEKLKQRTYTFDKYLKFIWLT
jgi:hypothetical protein